LCQAVHKHSSPPYRIPVSLAPSNRIQAQTRIRHYCQSSHCPCRVTGVDKARIEASGAAFTDYLLGVLRPEAMERIAWHPAQGHDVAIVSGGLDCYLRPWAKKHGLMLICSALEERNGKLTGRYKGPQCVRLEKARAARKYFGPLEGRRVYAYGDTPEDEDLLA